VVSSGQEVPASPRLQLRIPRAQAPQCIIVLLGLPPFLLEAGGIKVMPELNPFETLPVLLH